MQTYPARAVIDLDAIAANVRTLDAGTSAQVMAVVKADGYGHGAVPVARAALAAGATGLCVALVGEGVALRRAGIEVPILVLSQQPDDALGDLVAHRLSATVYSPEQLAAIAAWCRQESLTCGIHLKVDTGMQRVGARPDELVTLARLAADTPGVRVDAVFTHLACADEPSQPATAEQLARFDAVLAELDDAGLAPPHTHAANSAGALAHPAAHRSFVRAGIAVYGIAPGPDVAHLATDLRPALSLRARVSHVKHVAAGTHVSYGWRHRFGRDTTVATLPIGYADGVPRRLGSLPDRPGADVLIGGRRCPIVGVVTMDQLMVDVAPVLDAGGRVAVGDEAVLIGVQGSERITADEWASRLGTIAYEVVCAIGPRVPRRFVGEAGAGSATITGGDS